MSTSETHPTDGRPLGFWLRTVDGLLDRAFDEAFQAEEVSRRDWMLLNAVDGTVEAPWLLERLAHRGSRVRRLIERGWIAFDTDGWHLTPEGRSAKQRLSNLADGVRDRVAGAVGPERFASTLASLEAIARELGWDESREMDFVGGRAGRGTGGRDRHGSPEFGPRSHGRPGPSPRGFDHGEPRDLRPGGSCRGHGHTRSGVTQDAFERGFAAGFAQGRSAASHPAA